MSTTIEGKAILVTGANRGIGQALVTEALRRGAARVYAGTRRPYAHPDPRVTVLPMDITDEGQVRAAAARAGSLDILVNNAGVFLFDDLSDREALERHLSVNLFGTYGVIQAFLPSLIASGGAIVNNVSIAALAPIPVTPAYSLSKAAAFSLTQSLRMLLAATGGAGLRRADRADRHRHGPRPRHPEGSCPVRRARHLRRDRPGRGGHLPRSAVRHPRRRLAGGAGQGA